MQLLSPKLDVVFKTLFTSADSADILSDFLAAVLDVEVSEINNIEIQNTELLPEFEEQKYSRMDIVLKLKGKLVNIEMQMKKLSDFTERSLFYWARLYARDLEEGSTYRSLNQTISINICDFKMFDCEECHSVFHIAEDTRHEILTEKCRFDFLELPKANTDSRQIKRLKRWLDFFNLKNEEDAEMMTRTNDAPINKAVFILKKMSADERMREVARIREKALHDEASYLADAHDEGMAQGRAQGRAEGRAQGRAEGMDALMEAMRKLGVDESVLKEAAESIKN